MPKRATGIVKWFNETKGFGFIEHDSKDVFVHWSKINARGFKTLQDGQKVEFDLVETEKGLAAESVDVVA